MRPRRYKDQCDLAVKNLKAAVDIADELLGSLAVRSQSSSNKKLKLVFLHGMCRKATSLITLYEATQFEGIEEIGRSIFEGYVDLENLQNDPNNYTNFLLACSERQKLVFLEEHERRTEDPHSRSVVENLQMSIGGSLLEYKRQQKTVIQRICESLPSKYVETSKQGKPLKPRNFLAQKAKWAGLESDYNGFYRLMSPYSHHDVSSLAMYIIGPSAEIEWPPKKGKVASFNALYIALMSIRTSTIRIAKSLRKFNGPLRVQLSEIDLKFE